MDGYIARSRKQVTKLGIFLDPLADKLLVAAALLSLVEKYSLPAWIAMIIIGREFIVTGVRLIAAGEERVIPASILGKIKQVTQIIAIVAFLIGRFPFMPAVDFRFDMFAMGIAVVVTVYSGIDYIVKNRDVFDVWLK